MSSDKLRAALYQYAAETLSYMDTVRGFCEGSPKWMLRRETEVQMMMDIKDKTAKNRDSQRAELQQELAAVLKDTLGGLEELDRFLDAVENLAVSSLHVFTEENKVLHLPEGIRSDHVQVSITAARTVCPLLLEFRRDARAFFLPKLQNVEVLSYQLDRYIQTTKNICDKLQKRVIFLNRTREPLVDLHADLSDKEIKRMLSHINQLDGMRKNKSFRTVFLFEEEQCHGFISEFSQRRDRMLQFLTDLEQTAVQLDRMSKGAKISSVAGSSVGAVGGVLSIVGLALIPVTAGVSLALTMTGVGLGVTSGVSSAVTAAAEIGVNRTQKNKANETFKSFMEDVQSLQDCLEEVMNQTVTKVEAKLIELGVKVDEVVSTVGKGLNAAAKTAAAAKIVESSGKLVNSSSKLSRAAAVKGSLALSKTARAGLIGLNALFLGMDMYFIYKDGQSLANGSETELSQFIRARAALWSSEMDSWQEIHDFLIKVQETSEKNKFILETPFFQKGR